MGSFANSVFNLLVGWFTGVVASVWSALSSPNGGSFLSWIGDHWILIAVIICVAGVAVDVIIYVVRWRPHRVWASFYRRVSGKNKEDDYITDTDLSEEQRYTDIYSGSESDQFYDSDDVHEEAVETDASDERGSRYSEENYDLDGYRRPGARRRGRSYRYYSRESETSPESYENIDEVQSPVKWKVSSRDYEK